MDLQVVEKPVGSLHFKVCWLTLIYFFSSEKITAFICSGILFTKNLYHIETSQFVCIANQLSGFYILRDFTERYFGKGYSYSVTMSFIYNLFQSFFLFIAFLVYSFEIVVITSILQKMDDFENWYFNSLSAARYLFWSTVLFSACFR